MADLVEKSNQPDYQCAAYKEMSGPWELITDVTAGGRALKSKGETYLPKEQAEKPTGYQLRLKRSVFFNAYRKTRDALVGMVFKKNPQLQDDIPEQIVTDLENIDLTGTHIDVFAKEALVDQFDGHVFILVDMQPKLAEGSTFADEKAAGRRPFWIKYRANQALNWRTDVINGETVLTQITFEERTDEPKGSFGEQEVTRYRVFRLMNGIVTWEVYRRVKPDDTADAIVSESTGVTTLDRIPVAVAYGHQTGLLQSEPPLLDLAYLNIAHYQEYSDYRNVLHVANVPILVAKGLSTDEVKKFEVGPNSLSFVPEKGDLAYVEHKGSAIGAARQELIDLEQRMAMLGVSMLAAVRDTYVTATKERLNASEKYADLATMARSLQDAIETALDFHAQYYGLGKDAGGSVKIGVTDDLVLDAPVLAVLLQAVTAGKLSFDSWIAFLQQAIPTVDLEGELDKLKTQPGFGQAPPTIADLTKARLGVQKILAPGPTGAQ